MVKKSDCNSLTVVPEKRVAKKAVKPVVPVKLNGNNCKALLDTGAEVNVVNASLLSHF